ncbi:MAG: SAM-dependent methyltransferase, partial [Bifidobacteriaceae bacterium]|nr:SAM-dependent methyltransferase [Bifidobacteriaceae bacterium]
LFVSKRYISDFPGRKFAIQQMGTLNKKEVKKLLAGIEQANITVRNFPLNAVQLRKRLKLKDGGSTYIFATTTWQNEHLLITAKRT